MRRTSRLTVSLPLLALWTAGSFPAPAPAQVEPRSRPPQQTIFEVDRFQRGEEPVVTSSKRLTDENRQKIDTVAAWLVYELTNPVLWQQQPGKPTMNQWVTDTVAKHILDRTGLRRDIKPEQKVFVNEFGKAMVTHLKQVIGHSQPIVRVNAARTLALLGKSGYEPLADVLVEILQDPNQSDAIKLFALRGLGNLLAVPNFDLSYKTVIEDRAREAKVVTALIDFLYRKPGEGPAAGTADPEKVEVTKYLRREAVRAVQLRYDVLRDLTGKAIARPGLHLLRFALADRSIDPPPELSERVEALIGFVNMKPDDAQNLDFASFSVNWVTEDLVRQLINQQGTGKSTIPWKVQMARLKLGLENWKTHVAELNARRMPNLVVQVADMAIADVVGPIENGGRAAKVNAARLNQWKQNQRPKANSLYADDPASTINPGQ